MIFPQPVPLRPQEGEARYRRRRQLWLATLALIYLLMAVVLALRPEGLFPARGH